MSFTDHAVAVGGLPLRVERGYDSLEATGATNGDFGPGWRVDLASFRVASNGALGHESWIEIAGRCGMVFCDLVYTSSAPRYVSVVWPDGRQEVFDLAPTYGSTFMRGQTTAAFVGRPGTTSKLEVAGDNALTYLGGSLYSGAFGSGGVFDPTRFKLTARDGAVYLLDRGTGLVQATDPSGNSLTVTAGGVTSSRGESIIYTRDAAGRITKITSAAGSTGYAYDAAGRLVTVTNLDATTQTFGYGTAGLLSTIDGAEARRLRSVSYTPDGRVASVVDADGNAIALSYDVGARQQILTDPTGRLTPCTPSATAPPAPPA